MGGGARTSQSLISTVRAAATALRRKRFAETVNRQYAELQKDPEAWADYLAEAEQTHVRDGID